MDACPPVQLSLTKVSRMLDVVWVQNGVGCEVIVPVLLGISDFVVVGYAMTDFA